ncbi:Putative redox-active protein (C_GCAxxG_C_C) [Ferrimonas sediminum]|uniref:Putative redox-active protein (C_GCAxxG_C_C) n=1 Tax=Ferrimonas sediminum TaxID=718193 RepID=A0A1G8KQ57_9GAMM|nr:C-GCAxxG-C-C family (seleno)protein [Ferrimonas sediminum]SDI45519.1 Putative redox-active protein (C_GCAxxG_C_C) [Ferrimonas sediminum]
MKVDRRQAMGKIVGLASMAVGTSAVSPAIFAADACPGDATIGLGSGGSANLGSSLLDYANLDPMKVAKLAYQSYFKGGCMYGVFNAIVTELAAQGHEDACHFAAIPTNLAVYGGTGVRGWGTLCGCLNAAAMAINVLGGVDQQAVIDAVYRYYEKTSMPRGDQEFLDGIGAPTPDLIFGTGRSMTQEEIGQSVANSVLCHTSVSHWSSASGFGSGHWAKYERCAQVTAEIAYISAKYLNASLAGTLEAEGHAASNDQCDSCHAPTQREPDTYIGPDVKSHMECQTCHSSHEQLSALPKHADASECQVCHN